MRNFFTNFLHFQHWNSLYIFSAACLSFRQIIRRLAADVEPFVHCSTMAKLAITIWRQHFLRPNLLINIPENGLRPEARQSYEARRFFKLYSKITGQSIQTCDSIAGEHCSIGANGEGQLWLDGLIQLPNGQKIALEYYGCTFHGKSFGGIIV